MKNFFKLCTALIFFIIPTVSYGSVIVRCPEIESAKIYGLLGKEYEFVGTITNSKDPLSILNENSYASKKFENSLVVDFSRNLTSSASDASALNSSAAKPPFIVGPKQELIAFISANQQKEPRVSYEDVISCAKNSKKKSIAVDVKKRLKGVPSKQKPEQQLKVCQSIYGNKATATSNGCECEHGYWMRDAKCYKPVDYCAVLLGEGGKVSYDGNSCVCKSDKDIDSKGNYETDPTKGKCVLTKKKSIDHIVKNWSDNGGRCQDATHFSKKQKADCQMYVLHRDKYTWSVVAQKKEDVSITNKKLPPAGSKNFLAYDTLRPGLKMGIIDKQVSILADGLIQLKLLDVRYKGWVQYDINILNAVKSFQSQKNIKPQNGVFGKKTHEAFLKEMAQIK